MKNHTSRRSQRIQQQNSPYPASPFRATAAYQLDDLSDHNLSSRENSKMSTDLLTELVIAPLSESLQAFAKTQISAELNTLQTNLLDHSIIGAERLDQLIQSLLNQLADITRSDVLDLTNTKENNELFARHTKNFIKALHLLTKEQFTSLLLESSHAIVRTVLDDYEVYVSRNVNIFQNITRHHEVISQKEWKEVVDDEHALLDYAQAANEMGEKVWVTESNYFACNFCKNYFLPVITTDATTKAISSSSSTSNSEKHSKPKHLSIKFYMKELSAQQDEEEERQRLSKDRSLWDSLYEQLSGISLVDYPQHQIRLLDVGSCYNPLRKFPDLLPLFEVTAIDLCPADPSVFKCDFLTVEIPETYEDYQQDSRSHTMREATAKDAGSSGPSPELPILPPSYFHAIVMSLVLSYLPTPQAREIMIEKARRLLISPGHDHKPHNCGLLMIIEKQSIFTPPKVIAAITKKQQQSVPKEKEGEDAVTTSSSMTSLEEDSYITIDDWKATIASKGFFLVHYQLFVSSDKRKSHIFIFKTSHQHQQQQQMHRLERGEASSSLPHLSRTSVKPLWIKQDFLRRSSVSEEKIPLSEKKK